MTRISHINPLPAILLFFLAGLYVLTMPPGLTWANDGADGGDLISAAVTGGVPHPSGYPTYLLLAGPFLKIPFGTAALRANIFSAICMLGAVYFLYRLVLHVTGQADTSFLAGLLFGSLPLVWSQAVIAEVYGLHMLLLAAAVYVLVRDQKISWQPGAFSGMLLGLALGNHLTAVFVLPILLWVRSAALPPGKRWTGALAALAPRLAGLVVGASVYLLLPLRAYNHAPVCWGNPQTWDGFWWLVSGSMYHGRLNQFSWSFLWTGVQQWSCFLLLQLTIPGVIMGIIYIFVRFKADLLHSLTAWLVIAVSCFSIYYYSPDSYVYLLLPLFAFSIWIGLGVDCGLKRIETMRPGLRRVAVIVLAVLIVGRAIWWLPVMDLSSDEQAEHYAQALLSVAPPAALILTSGDEALFSLWYYHYALGKRSDLAVISTELMIYPWYRGNLAETYPGLHIPSRFTIRNLSRANPGRPVCIPAPDLDPRLECVSD